MDFSLRIGGLTFAVHGSEVALEEPHTRFAVEPAPADVDVFITYDDSYTPPRGRLLFDSGAVWQLFEDPAGFRIECNSAIVSDRPYKIATVTRDFRRVDLQMRVNHLQPLQFPLDEVLVNALLARRRGVELHACGVIDRGTGLLFIGNSGDGKTTTAKLWSAAVPAAGPAASRRRDGGEPAGEDAGAPLIVSDDRVVLRAENGGWTMYGTPWHGEAEICSPAHAPLRRIYVLDKTVRGNNGVTPLRPAEAVARLFSCTFPPFHDPRGLETVVDTLGALAMDVPVARLSFLNDPTAVDFVRQEAAA